MSNQTLSADAQLAKCNVLNSDAEIASLREYGIDCGLNKKQDFRDALGAYIWLAESGCLTLDQECKVGKEINRKRMISLCEMPVEDSCDKTVKCSIITIEVSEGDSCDPSKPITISVT